MPAQAWVTLVVGGLATLGVLITWRQKNNADRRAEWWRRVSWAFDHALSDDPAEAEFGWLIVNNLAGSRFATKEDAELFQTVAEQWISSDNEDTTKGDDDDNLDTPPGHDDVGDETSQGRTAGRGESSRDRE